MAKINKNHVLIGLIGLVTVSGSIAAYIQYQKLMNYVISFSRIKIITLSTKLISFDLFIKYQNKSDITINIKDQEYKIYVNGQYVSKAFNDQTSIINANSTTEIGIKVSLDPASILKTVKKSWQDILLNPENVKIRVESKLNLLLWKIIPISIPYTYDTNLKELKS